jgi:hypothetical protein
VDEIRLKLPRDRAYFPVARLVLSGVGARLELTVEGLDDLELALEALLERARGDGELSIAVRVGEERIEAELGPFSERLRTELEQQEGVTLGRILGTLVDDVDITARNSGEWVTLHKRVTR